MARPHAGYSLVIDAGDRLDIPPGFELPDLKADLCTLEVWRGDRWERSPHLVNNARAWRYEGILHEFLSCRAESGSRILPEDLEQSHISGLKIIAGQGSARCRRPAAERYGEDAEALERALAAGTDPFLEARYTFYLAQSYQNAGKPEPALRNYLKRAELNFSDQEVYVCLYRAANLKAELGYGAGDVIATYLKAHAAGKTRAEALHGAAAYCRKANRFEDGYRFAKGGLALTAPAHGLFQEDWIYSYGLADECAVCAYWIGKFDECLRLSDQLLSEGEDSCPHARPYRKECRLCAGKTGDRQYSNLECVRKKCERPFR